MTVTDDIRAKKLAARDALIAETEAQLGPARPEDDDILGTR